MNVDCETCWDSEHIATSQSRRMSMITSLVHGPVVFVLVLATQISRPHSTLCFPNFLRIRVSWHPVQRWELETQVALFLCITDATTWVHFVNFCELHALFSDLKRYVLKMVEHNFLLPDGVNARKQTYTDSLLGMFAKLRKAIIISIMPVRPSGQPPVCSSGRIRLP